MRAFFWSEMAEESAVKMRRSGMDFARGLCVRFFREGEWKRSFIVAFWAKKSVSALWQPGWTATITETL